jgi:hypothetical protein
MHLQQPQDIGSTDVKTCGEHMLLFGSKDSDVGGVWDVLTQVQKWDVSMQREEVKSPLTLH